jgi:hypothetical protein
MTIFLIPPWLTIPISILFFTCILSYSLLSHNALYSSLQGTNSNELAYYNLDEDGENDVFTLLSTVIANTQKQFSLKEMTNSQQKKNKFKDHKTTPTITTTLSKHDYKLSSQFNLINGLFSDEIEDRRRKSSKHRHYK